MTTRAAASYYSVTAQEYHDLALSQLTEDQRRRRIGLMKAHEDFLIEAGEELTYRVPN